LSNGKKYKEQFMNNYLPTTYQQYIYLSRYSRWLPDQNRRENWNETVARYFNFFQEHLQEQHNHNIDSYRSEVEDAILSLKVVPSMRCLMTAGEALKRENIAGFNCSFAAVNRPQAFDEILYILMNGCFHEDTLIKTLDGDKKIKDLTCEDKVLTYDIEENKYEYTNPLWVIPTPHSAEKEKIKLIFEDGSSVLCTEDHEFYTNRGWVKAKDLTEDDDIVNYNEIK
jgi:hypothetical protein